MIRLARACSQSSNVSIPALHALEPRVLCARHATPMSHRYLRSTSREQVAYQNAQLASTMIISFAEHALQNAGLVLTLKHALHAKLKQLASLDSLMAPGAIVSARTPSLATHHSNVGSVILTARPAIIRLRTASLVSRTATSLCFPKANV